MPEATVPEKYLDQIRMREAVITGAPEAVPPVDSIWELVCLKRMTGDLAGASDLCLATLKRLQDLGMAADARLVAEALVVLGDAAVAAGQHDDALARYREGEAVLTGYAPPWNRRMTLVLAAMNWPPPKAPGGGAPVIACDILGEDGRFGDSVMQYLALCALADATGADLSVGRWMGRYIFSQKMHGGLSDSPIGDAPRALSRAADGLGRDLQTRGVRKLFGAALVHAPDSVWGVAPQALALRPELVAIARNLMAELSRDGRPVAAAHIRRTDRLSAEAPDFRAYRDWLAAMIAKGYAGFVATDDPAAVRAAFADLDMRTIGDLPAAQALPPALLFLADWAVLARADALLLSRSSFSVTAALAGPRTRRLDFADPDRSRVRRLSHLDPMTVLGPF